MRKPDGRLRSTCGACAKTSMRSGSRCRKGSRTCRRWPWRVAWPSQSRRSPCGGGGFDSEREDVGSVDPDTYNAGSGMGADHRTERLDHEGLAVGFELARHAIGVGLRICVPHDDAQALASIDLARQLDHTVERAVKRANAFQWRHEPVPNA